MEVEEDMDEVTLEYRCTCQLTKQNLTCPKHARAARAPSDAEDVAVGYSQEYIEE